jgi:DNA-binding protein HU-beta
MTKAQIVSEISESTKVAKETVSEIVESFLKVVKSSLSDGNDIFIRGFGTYSKKKRAKKIARDITRNKSIIVPEHYIPHFKPSDEFKEMIRNSSNNKA